jgi:hypothetical protein
VAYAIEYGDEDVRARARGAGDKGKTEDVGDEREGREPPKEYESEKRSEKRLPWV